MSFRKIALWLFVINLGICFGAGLYEAAIELPHWLVETGGAYTWHPEAAQSANSGMRFWVFVSTFPLTLITVANIFAAWKTKGDLKRWWFTAIGFTVTERLLTFFFFIPTMILLLQSTSNPEATAQALTWAKMNYLRHILNFAGWMCALKAFSLNAR